MNPLAHQSVHRYFELADSFVEIRALEGDGLELRRPAGLNRCAYRRLVIQTCMPAFSRDVERALERLFPEDPLLAEDLLYQLCVEVNPHLDIGRVRLVSREQSVQRDEGAASETANDEESFLRRLRRRVTNLERRLKERIVGQDEAVRRIVQAVERASVGLAPLQRPLGCFLFAGRTGTGKTELARALAHELYSEDGGTGLVRIDCSEFGLAHEYSKLIGAPPGYVGHEDGGRLTEALRKRPESLVLFDEIEKAHPKLHHLLLQVLEEGALTDGKGRTVSFERALVVLTSNVGASDIQAAGRPLGFERGGRLEDERLVAITEEAVRRQFSPEFVGRLDEVLFFRDLDERSARRIAQRELVQLARRARRRGVVVAFTPAVARWVAARGFSPDHGARELRHVIQREIEPRLARVLLGLPARGEALLRARVRDDEPVFELED